MLAACLLVALLGLTVSTPLLFTPVARMGNRWVSIGAAGALGIGCAWLAMTGLDVRRDHAAVAAALLALVCLGWLPFTGRWGAAGRLAWGCAVWAGGIYLAYMLSLTIRSHLGLVGTLGGLLLWTLEIAGYLLGLAYLWEMVDVLASRHWRRRVDVGSTEPLPQTALPFVSLHVPAHNEPPDMVIETLESLLALDYPSYEVVLVDDNTSDPALWLPVQTFCAVHPSVLRFHHLEDWPGFKSGALNFALTVTDPRAEVIGVVDSDYLVDPDYLRRCAAMFATERRLGFVQTPQDYRDWKQSAYFRRLYHSYAYFFAVSQASRNEQAAPIFGGTMGLIRRSALTAAGGWDEWCITEDAELSLRLLRAGWRGRHIDQSYGRGVMPLTFDALKRQRYRWCFGGIQILRLLWRSLLPWDRDPANHLTPAQRWAYLSGGLQWYGDLLGLAFVALLSAGILSLAFDSSIVFRQLSGFLLVAVPVLPLLNSARALALLKRSTGASRRDAAGAFGIWLALGWTVATASIRGLLAPAGVFQRTPKTRGEASLRDAVNTNRAETTIAAALCVVLAMCLTRVESPARWVLASLLIMPLLGALAAPWNALAALRAELPDELRRRRRTERLRAWTSGPLRRGRIVRAGVLAVGAGAAGILILAPHMGSAELPGVLEQAQGNKPDVGPHVAPQAGASATGNRTQSPATSMSAAPPTSPAIQPTARSSRGHTTRRHSGGEPDRQSACPDRATHPDREGDT